MTKIHAKLCGFFVLSFALPLLGFFGSSSASAQTSLIDDIRLVDKIEVGNKDYYNNNCGFEDMTGKWGGFIMDKDNWQAHNRTYQSWRDYHHPRIVQALQNGEYTIVTQTTDTQNNSNSQFQKTIQIYYNISTESPALTYFMNDISYYSSRMSIGTDVLGGCKIKVIPSNYTNYSNHVMYTHTNPSYNGFFLSTAPFNYPEGYNGALIPQTHTPTPTLNIKFDYNVANKDVTLKFHDINPDLDYYHGYDIRRTGDIGCGNGDTPTCKPPHEAKQFKDGSAGKDGEVKFTVPKHGYYIVGVALWPPDIPPDDATTDNMIKGSTMLWVDLKIDGSYFNGIATNQEDTGDLYNCETDTLDGSETTRCNASVQKPCEVTGLTDLFPFIGCVMGNFFNGMKSLSFQLIIPDWSNVAAQFNKTMASIKISLGFLWAPIDFIIQTFNLVIGQTNNPTGNTCNIGNISMFGSSSSGLHLCAWRYQFPQLWQYMQIFIQGGIAFGFTLAFWRKFMSIFGHEVGEYLDDDASFSQGENFGSNRTYVKGDSPAGFREMMPKGDPDKKYRR